MTKDQTIRHQTKRLGHRCTFLRWVDVGVAARSVSGDVGVALKSGVASDGTASMLDRSKFMISSGY